MPGWPTRATSTASAKTLPRRRRWRTLRDAGARPQRPLWASTGTKDPAYSDVLYVEKLIAPDVVNTMPEATLRAFADHGDVRNPLSIAGAANETLRRAQDEGIDLDAVTSELEREGVSSFCDSYHELLDCIETKLQSTLPASGGATADRVGS